MENMIIIDGSEIIQKFNESLLEFIQAEGDLPEEISIVAEGTRKELGTITIKKTIFEKPSKGE